MTGVVGSYAGELDGVAVKRVVELTADPGAKPGAVDVTVVARAGEVRATGRFRLEITAPPPPPIVELPKPKPPKPKPCCAKLCGRPGMCPTSGWPW